MRNRRQRRPRSPQQHPEPAPVRILRAEKPESPNSPEAENDAKEKPENEGPKKPQKPAAVTRPQRLRSVRLLTCTNQDQALRFRISLQEAVDKLGLSESGDFTVIGALGGEGVGKSTILSRFCSAAEDRFVFQPEARLGQITTGVDAWVTSERAVLLDTQPIMSASRLATLITRECPESIKSHMALVELESIRIALWLFSVCHVVLVISDWFTDPMTWNLIRACFMLREVVRVPEFLQGVKKTAVTERGERPKTVQALPDIIFLFNKVEESYMRSPSVLSRTRNNLNTYFKRESFRKSMNPVANVVHLPSPKPGGTVHCFFLPALDSKNFKDEMMELKKQVFAMPKKNRAARWITEKEWLTRAIKAWDILRSDNCLMDFVQGRARRGRKYP